MGNGAGPMSKVWVLPRFASNREYDIFMASIKDTWMSRLMQSKRSHNVMRKVLTRLYNEGRFVIDTPIQNYTNLVGKNDTVTTEAAWGIVERSLSPSYFYGLPIGDEDLRDVGPERGDQQRYKVLMRAPFHCFQIVNPTHPSLPSTAFARQRLYAVNIRKALSTELSDFEALMSGYLRRGIRSE